MVRLPKREDSMAEFILPEEGGYTVQLDRLSDVRLGKFPDKNGELHPEQEFYFKIIDDDEFEGCELREYVRVDTFYDGTDGGQPAKVFLIAKALLGPECDPDNPPDTEDLVGLKCNATVVHKKSIALDGNERTYARLTGFTPIRRRRSAAARSVNDQVESIDDVPF